MADGQGDGLAWCLRRKRVRYREASAVFQALLASLTYQDGGCAGEKGEGARNATISFAAAHDKQKDLQQRLGRCSELHVRTSKIVVVAFQQEVAQVV